MVISLRLICSSGCSLLSLDERYLVFSGMEFVRYYDLVAIPVQCLLGLWDQNRWIRFELVLV